jgi:predicted 2-oxoglutarate/Fe(II)-dependent dioxygenase YbiX
MSIDQPVDFPLLHHFREYVIYDGFLMHEADRIWAMWDAGGKEKARVSGDKVYAETLRKSSVTFLNPSENSNWIYERITTLAMNCNAERYRFELNGLFEPLQMAEYQQGDFFDWHLDFGVGEVSHRKLSVTVQLSDENAYEGGDLQFMINNRVENAPRRKGSLIVFPSFIQHRVTKITAGKRSSIVGWLSGPPYR